MATKIVLRMLFPFNIEKVEGLIIYNLYVNRY